LSAHPASTSLLGIDDATRDEALAIGRGRMRHGAFLPKEAAVPFVLLDFPDDGLTFDAHATFPGSPAARCDAWPKGRRDTP
jgi:hypothetical protein